jgi:GTP-binding protein
MLAITKADLLDDELEKMLSKELPDEIRHIFISSLTGKNIQQLKDMLWEMLTES